ncbi:MAG TPA: ferrous iron transporter B [Thermoanaerobaculia bacterium]|nr:ferrous iron transporter B [Thermoanaerobaculia bacterium]
MATLQPLRSHESSRAAPARQPVPKVLLIGNPNVGKSLLFKNLTHRYVNVSNFPGTTVEITRARSALGPRDLEIVDSPGINDLSPRSDEARVTRSLLEQNPGATVVQVADAKNLRRALLLTLQLAELGCPMVLVLNMLDELGTRGGRIDQDELSRILDIPVIGAVALRNEGTEDLVKALGEARPARTRTGDEETPDDLEPYERNRLRLARVNEILAACWSMSQPSRASLGIRLGYWAMHPVKGLAFLFAVLFMTFWFVGLLGAGTLVDLMETGLFQQRLTPLAIRAADAVLPFPHTHQKEAVELSLALPVTPVHEVAIATSIRTVLSPAYDFRTGLGTGQEILRFFHDFLVGEYGVITMALSYAFAIVLPIVTSFFLLFSLLEDSGYLPRMSILVNRIFRLMGLNGKAVLPMILGLGCDTMATMTTRILETRKERLVTTMLLALAVPCSAQLGVLLAMMASLSPGAAITWCGIMLGVILLVGWLSARAFPGEAGDFLLEIPPMRRPQLANVWIKTLGRLNWYLREVIPLFIVGTAALFLLDRLDLLAALSRFGEPLVAGWLGLPPETSAAFLIGFLRRDFGAVYLLDASTGPNPLLTPHQIFVSMVTITLFMPCIANFLMIAREHSLKIAWAMAGFIFPFAFLVGGIIHHISIWLTLS